MEILRAFIAVEMPSPVADAARKAQQALKQSGIQLRWVHPENIHLTLRFLGDTRDSAIPAIREAVLQAAATCDPFLLRAKGVGVFPQSAHPSVVWMGLEGRLDSLDTLYRALSGSLEKTGIPTEKRPFAGHLTLGRVKDRLDPERLRSSLASLADFATEPFTAETLCLFKSDLTPKGPIYTRLADARLGNLNH